MKRKFLFILAIIIILIPSFMFLNNNNGVTDSAAFRSSIDTENIYLDDNLVALSEDSNMNTNLRSEALKAFNLVNEQRAAAGLSPLTWSSDIEQTSYVRSSECSLSFSHTRPNGKKWYTVNSSIMGGENLAYGFSNANDAIKAWMASSTHKENILYPSFTKIAISVYVSDNGTYYWAQEFGY